MASVFMLDELVIVTVSRGRRCCWRPTGRPLVVACRPLAVPYPSDSLTREADDSSRRQMTLVSEPSSASPLVHSLTSRHHHRYCCSGCFQTQSQTYKKKLPRQSVRFGDRWDEAGHRMGPVRFATSPSECCQTTGNSRYNRWTRNRRCYNCRHRDPAATVDQDSGHPLFGGPVRSLRADSSGGWRVRCALGPAGWSVGQRRY